MDARADLASSVNSCRKLENFQVDQYGEAIRRPGLQYVGGALGECLAIDPLQSFPNWDAMTDSEAITPVDQYGSLGPEEARKEANPADWWLVCDWLVHCYGPTDEGVPMVNNYDQYATRWRAKLEDGIIYYGKVGEQWRQIGTDLYPDVLDDAIGLGFAFDANARPVFATQIGADIEIRRYVAGVPTTYTFSGIGPRLFFNGVIQPDNSLWDVVCYYADSGDLKERFQRDNFNVAYTLYSNASNYLIRVKHIDVGIDGLTGRVCIAASGNNAIRMMFVSGVYGAWPIYSSDTATVTVSISGAGEYVQQILDCGEVDSVYATASIYGTGDYQPQIYTDAESDSAFASASIYGSGQYQLQVVSESEAEYVSAVAEIYGTGNYSIQIISGGTYSESLTATAAIYGSGIYEIE